jgi:hypothetical protein
VKFEVYPTTERFNELTPLGAAAHAVMFWVKFLPLNLGIIAVLGWIGMYARRSRNFEDKALKYISVAAAIGFLLVAQFLRSAIMNNDLGWRAVLVPVMLLNAWTAATLAELACGPAFLRWSSSFFFRRWQYIISMVGCVGLICGLVCGAVRYWEYYPLGKNDCSTTITLHRRFAQQPWIWARVREYCGPRDLVQSNPDGYEAVTRWPIDLPFVLLADRPAALASPHAAMYLATGYSRDDIDQHYKKVKDVFSESPNLDSIRFLHGVLGVKVVVVDPGDGVWKSDAIERSGLYKIMYHGADAKIYLSSQ